MPEASPNEEHRETLFKAPVRKWYIFAICVAAAGLLLAGGVAVYQTRPVEDHNKLLVSVGEGFVRSAIREELKTSFSGAEETRIEVLPDHKFLIAGWVDVVSATGQVARQDFSCVVHKNTSDEWVGEKITVIPQQL